MTVIKLCELVGNLNVAILRFRVNRKHKHKGLKQAKS